MRLFIAIELPEDIKDEIVEIEEELRTFWSAKWVERDNIHLTLKFLGEIEDGRIEEVKRIVSETSQMNYRLSLNLENIGGFPNLKKPRIIWIGVREVEKRVVNIMENLEEKFIKFGIEPERKKKTPHITIGRIKGYLGKYSEKESKVIDGLIYKSRIFRVESISVIKSVLTPKGAIHTVIKQYPLKTL